MRKSINGFHFDPSTIKNRANDTSCICIFLINIVNIAANRNTSFLKLFPSTGRNSSYYTKLDMW